MNDVSAMVVTLNEEENIENCLETLEWCDEIIIVDGYSNDQTVSLAKEYTNKVYMDEPAGYGDPARKIAIEEASNEWICMLDADEMIPKKLANRLERLAKNSEADVIYAPRMNFSLGEWIDNAGFWPDYRPILFRKKQANLSDDVHDFINFDEETASIKMEQDPDIAIRHFNHTNLHDKIDRINKYTTIESEQIEYTNWGMVSRSILEFVNRYFIQTGFRSGVTGLILSILQAWYVFLSYLKAREAHVVGSEEDINAKYDHEKQKVLQDWS
ncbi:glycosyltransferase family 2 protein [Salinigranum marinum]|uniref:glycosyltransferase family 2 protein n=1 Tax=Salinigranum marinum TaxID=1515595 RepID=UPI002989CC0D|nr:glycosyltransferase family 2 protein [Salinigranum marinum]